MPANTTIDLDVRTWTLLTSADITAARVQVVGGPDVFVQATVGATPPSDTDGAMLLRSGPAGGFAADMTLANLFPGVSGANRLYAWSEGAARVSVSHA